jgi:hypothetical protein
MATVPDEMGWIMVAARQPGQVSAVQVLRTTYQRTHLP